MKKYVKEKDTFVDSEGEINDGKYIYTVRDDGVSVEIELYDASGFSSTLTMPESYEGMPIEVISSFTTERIDGVRKIRQIKFSRSLKVIGYHAFFEFWGLKSLSIPKGIVEIGEGAFGFCTSLDEVNIGCDVKTVGCDAFSHCKSLKEVKLPEALTTLGARAFLGCETLKRLFIPKGISYIGPYCFSECYDILEFEVDEENASFSAYAGALYSKDRSELIRYPTGKEDEIYLMPARVTKVREAAFEGALNLKKLYISDNLKEMNGDYFSPVSPTEAKTSGISYLQIGKLYDRIEVYARFERK